jgi:hypothetical protein
MNKISIYIKALVFLSLLSANATAMKAEKSAQALEAFVKQLEANDRKGGSSLEQITDLMKKIKAQKKTIRVQRSAIQEHEKTIEELNLEKALLEKQNRSLLHTTKKRSLLVDRCEDPSFTCSPSNAQNLIYMMYIADAQNASMIEEVNRIDVERLLQKPLNQQNLFEFLLAVEIKLLELIKARPEIVQRTLYVGLTSGTLEKRFVDHFKKQGLELKQLSTTKSIAIQRALSECYNVKTSYILKNIRDFLPVFEALVSHVLLAQENGGSAVIANRADWTIFIEYKKSAARIEALKKLKLETVVYDIARELFERKLEATRVVPLES